MGLAPTTSTTLMLVLGDALAVALMERKGFSADQYRDFHPGGSLGRVLIRVSDLMRARGAAAGGAGHADARGARDAGGASASVASSWSSRPAARAGIITDGDLAPAYRGATFSNAQAACGDDAAPKIRPARSAGRRGAGLHERKEDHPLFVLAAGRERPMGILHIHDCLRAGLQ